MSPRIHVSPSPVYVRGAHRIESVMPIASSGGGGGFSNLYSLSTDGTSQAVDVGNNFDTDGLSARSWSFWVKPTSTAGTMCVVAKFADSVSGGPGWAVQIQGGGTFRYIKLGASGDGSDAAVAVTSVTIPTGVWTHLIVTDSGSGSGSGIDLYVNGVRDDFMSRSGTLSSTTSNSKSAYIAAGNDTVYGGFIQYYGGLINQPSYYGTQLSAAEVTAIYNAGTPDDLTGFPGLESWYQFQQNLLDAAGSANGTGVNSPTYSTDVPPDAFMFVFEPPAEAQPVVEAVSVAPQGFWARHAWKVVAAVAAGAGAAVLVHYFG